MVFPARTLTPLAAPSLSATEATETVVRPPGGSVSLGISEVWAYRELLYFLVWRDLKVRYKQTLIGAAWAIIQPLFTMLVFTLVFGRLANIPSDGIPYPVFFYSALVPWTYFAAALQGSTNAIVDHQRLVTKVYFPRLALPLAATLTGLVDFAIAFSVLLVMAVWFGPGIGWTIVAVPVLMVLVVLTALGVGIWLSSLNAMYRDVRHGVPFLVQLWMFASPVAYPSSLVPENWRWLYGLNPMAGVIDGFRWATTGQGEAPGAMLAVSACVMSLVLGGAIVHFRRVESQIADLL